MEQSPAMIWKHRALAFAVTIAAWLAGTAALALARVDASPGIRPTAVLLLAAWAPMVLPARRAWTRELCVYLTFAIVLVHLGWWAVWDPPSRDSLSLPVDGMWVLLVNPWNGHMLRDGDLGRFVRTVVFYAMAGLLGCFPVVWCAFHRELRSPGRDSGAQVAVLAGAWLAVAGCVGALDAFTRSDAVRSVQTVELTRPRLQLAAGGLSAGIGVLGMLAAVGAAAVVRRRERWLARVAAGAIDGWSIVPYAPEWGALDAIPRLIGGEPPADPKWNELEAVPRRIGEGPPVDPAQVTIVLRRSSHQQVGGDYRSAPTEEKTVWGRLDASPWTGGLRLARRCEKDVPALARSFAWAFVLSIVPMMLVRLLRYVVAVG
jgi:hypothetical protein